MMNNSYSNCDVNETDSNSTPQEPLTADLRMNCEPEKERDELKKSMENGVGANMASVDDEDLSSMTPDEENKQPVVRVQVQSGKKEAKETDDNPANPPENEGKIPLAGCEGEKNPTVCNTSEEPTEEESGVQDTFSEDISYQKKCEKLTNINKVLAEQNKKLKEENKRLCDVIGQSPLDWAVPGLEHEINQLEIGEDYETKYDGWKEVHDKSFYIDQSEKINDLEKENNVLKKENNELKEENNKLKETIKDTKTDNVDGRKRNEEVKNMAVSSHRQPVLFPSVFDDGSEPNLPLVNSFKCPASCVMDVLFFVFEKMGLGICRRTFVVEMQVSLGEIPEAKVVVGKCCLSLEDLVNLWLIEGKTAVIWPGLDGIDSIDRALQEAIAHMDGYSYPALLLVRYKTKPGHCLAIMHKTDPADPRVRMEVFDVQKNKRWPKCDRDAESITQIELYRVHQGEAKEWEENCGKKKCEDECRVCYVTYFQ